MFKPKSNSKHKRVKKTQERETGSLPLNNSLGEEITRWASQHLGYSLGEEKHSLWRVGIYSPGD